MPTNFLSVFDHFVGLALKVKKNSFFPQPTQNYPISSASQCFRLIPTSYVLHCSQFHTTENQRLLNLIIPQSFLYPPIPHTVRPKKPNILLFPEMRLTKKYSPGRPQIYFLKYIFRGYSPVFFSFFFFFCIVFCLFVCFLKLKIYILIHIRLGGRVSDKKNFTRSISRNKTTFFWPLEKRIKLWSILLWYLRFSRFHQNQKDNELLQNINSIKLCSPLKLHDLMRIGTEAFSDYQTYFGFVYRFMFFFHYDWF